mgnify:CR=1 FL=1
MRAERFLEICIEPARNAFEREVVRLFESYDIECKRAWGSNGQSLGLHEEVDSHFDSDSYLQIQDIESR